MTRLLVCYTRGVLFRARESRTRGRGNLANRQDRRLPRIHRLARIHLPTSECRGLFSSIGTESTTLYVFVVRASRCTDNCSAAGHGRQWKAERRQTHEPATPRTRTTPRDTSRPTFTVHQLWRAAACRGVPRRTAACRDMPWSFTIAPARTINASSGDCRLNAYPTTTVCTMYSR